MQKLCVGKTFWIMSETSSRTKKGSPVVFHQSPKGLTEKHLLFFCCCCCCYQLLKRLLLDFKQLFRFCFKLSCVKYLSPLQQTAVRGLSVRRTRRLPERRAKATSYSEGSFEKCVWVFFHLTQLKPQKCHCSSSKPYILDLQTSSCPHQTVHELG